MGPYLVTILVSIRFKLTKIFTYTLPFRKRQSVLFMFLSEMVSRIDKRGKRDL